MAKTVAERRAEKAEQDAAKHLVALRRMERLLMAREELLPFVQVTMPDVNRPDDPVASRYHPARHHEALAAALQKVESGEWLNLIITMPPRHGKALALDTPIPTPDGWVSMGDLRPGSVVFDEVGRPCNVVAVSPVWRNRRVFSVTTDDGHTVIADEGHEWLVRLCRKRPRFKVKTTGELARRACVRKPYVAPHGALALPAVDLPIDPYVLGVWLGDGCTHHATITAGDEDAAFIRSEFERRGYPTTDRATAQTFGVLGLSERLRGEGLLGAKFVPADYMRASEAQRRDLLRGMIDSDGHVAPDGQIEFCSTDRGLAMAVREIVHTLGHKASLIEGRAMLDGRDCGPKWRVMFYAAGVALLPRKAGRCRSSRVRPGRYISIEEAGTADTVCIEVDSESHLFLAGSGMVPTHNSELASRRLIPWFVGRDPTRSAALGTYSDDLAGDFGRDVRNIMEDPLYQELFPGAKLRKGSKSADRMQTEAGGMLFFVGRGTGITGRGADLIVIDDPLKNRDEADSKAIRDKVWKWWQDDIQTRVLDDGGRFIIIMTRWHEDDLVGRLTDPNNPHFVEEEALKWRVLDLPALAREDDALGRAVGEPLWPARFGKTHLEAIRTRNPRGFASLYQGRPSPEEGDDFKAEWIKTYQPRDLPKNLRNYAASDHAIKTGQENDRSCLGCGGVDEDGVLWVLPTLHWGRWPPDETVEKMLDVMRIEKPVTWLAENEHISGTMGPFLRRRMRDEGLWCVIDPYTTRKDKRATAATARAMLQAGLVRFPSGAPWWADARDELLKFPNATHDDFVSWLSLLCILVDRMVRARRPLKGPPPMPKTGTMAWVKWSTEQERKALVPVNGGF